MFLHIEHINHSARGCMHGYGHVGGYKAAIIQDIYCEHDDFKRVAN